MIVSTFIYVYPEFQQYKSTLTQLKQLLKKNAQAAQMTRNFEKCEPLVSS